MMSKVIMKPMLLSFLLCMHPVYCHDGGFAGVLKYALSDSCLDIIVRFLYIKGDGGIEMTFVCVGPFTMRKSWMVMRGSIS